MILRLPPVTARRPFVSVIATVTKSTTTSCQGLRKPALRSPAARLTADWLKWLRRQSTPGLSLASFTRNLPQLPETAIRCSGDLLKPHWPTRKGPDYGSQQPERLGDRDRQPQAVHAVWWHERTRIQRVGV